jgi:hypothetical protein
MRPQALAYLTDSPATLGAWIFEKVHTWTDDDECPRGQLLAKLPLHWLTGTFGAAAPFHAESLRRPWQAARRHAGDPGADRRRRPAKENSQAARRFCEQCFDLRRYGRMPQGGHFAARRTSPASCGQFLSAP